MRPDPCCLGSGRNSFKASSYSLFYASSEPEGQSGSRLLRIRVNLILMVLFDVVFQHLFIVKTFSLVVGAQSSQDIDEQVSVGGLRHQGDEPVVLCKE